MIKCVKCGHENPEGALICAECGQPFILDIKDGSTRRLNEEVERARYLHWGTARLGNERKILLHIQNAEKPLMVSLIRQIVIGRFDVDTNQTPDIDLSEYGAQEKGVSRRHVTIMIEDETIKVMDMGSANCTFMNGQKLIPNQARILRDGDELRLGRLVMRVNFI